MRALTFAAARLEGTRTLKLALTTLVATFSDEQKKTAHELLAPHMGIMAMMLAMRGGSVKGMGNAGGQTDAISWIWRAATEDFFAGGAGHHANKGRQVRLTGLPPLI